MGWGVLSREGSGRGCYPKQWSGITDANWHAMRHRRTLLLWWAWLG